MSILRIDDTDKAYFLEYGRGDSFSYTWTLKDSTGTEIDITGYSFKLTVNQSFDPSDQTEELFSIDGVIVDAVNGKVSFSPSATDTNQEPNTYYYDIQITDSGGRIRTALISRFTVTQDITKV